MAEQDDGDALAGDGSQALDDPTFRQGVLSGGGFVRDDRPGAEQEGLGEDHSLLLAAGQLMRKTAQHRFRVG